MPCGACPRCRGLAAPIFSTFLTTRVFYKICYTAFTPDNTQNFTFNYKQFKSFIEIYVFIKVTLFYSPELTVNR